MKHGLPKNSPLITTQKMKQKSTEFSMSILVKTLISRFFFQIINFKIFINLFPFPLFFSLGEQRMNIFRGDRLLGMLAPLRAFGDFRFKWDAKVIQDTIGNLLGHQAVPGYYKSPPYLTVEPDVISHKLSPKDRFLVIGSDGLWDMMTPMQVKIFWNSSLENLNKNSKYVSRHK